jgi:copper oxidase (laccase) domain-containing protein
MQERYGSQPKDILAVVGPAIGPDMYEVGGEVIEAVQEAFGRDAPSLLPQFGESTHFDLWAANRLTLEQAGVQNVQVSEICTGTHTEDWFSHRAEKGKTGRFGVLMGLNEQ